MIAGSADGHLVPFIPDDTGDPRRAGGVLLHLLAAPLPYRFPLRTGEVRRQWHGARRVRGGQVTVAQGTEHARRQMNDADMLRERPFRRVSMLLWIHWASMPDPLVAVQCPIVVEFALEAKC